MKWIYLIAALVFETIGFISLKYSNGFTKTLPVIITVVVDVVAVLFFIGCLKKFETGFVYIVAAGAGTALVVFANAVVFKQSFNWVQLICIVLIIAGTVGLHSQGTAH